MIHFPVNIDGCGILRAFVVLVDESFIYIIGTKGVCGPIEWPIDIISFHRVNKWIIYESRHLANAYEKRKVSEQHDQC